MEKEKDKFKNIIFDCDSSLARIEGLPFIASRKGLEAEISRITEEGMNGAISFQESLSRRLKILNLTSDDLEIIERGYIDNLTEGAVEVIRELQRHGLEVFIVSGALLPPVQGLADFLGVPKANALAIPITVDSQARVQISDDVMSKVDRLKREAVKRIRQSGPTVLVGDGMTDWEAGKDADLFIGFGGVVFRPKLKELATVYIEEPRLQGVLDIVL